MNIKMPWAVPTRLLKPEGEGGSGGSGDGGAGGSSGNSSGGADDKSQMVPLATHKETLDKFHSANTQVKNLAGEVEKLKNELKSKSTSDSEKNGDFKSLYETAKSEKEQLATRHEDFKKSVYNNERLKALEAETKKRGLRQGSENVLDFADLEKMPIELTSKGRILVQGVEEAAADLEKKYNFAFGKPAAPNINTGGGNGGANDGEVTDDKLTAEYMVELERKDMKKYKEVFPRFVKLSREKRQ